MILPPKADAEALDHHRPAGPCWWCKSIGFWQELRFPDSLVCRTCRPDFAKNERAGEARQIEYDPRRPGSSLRQRTESRPAPTPAEPKQQETKNAERKARLKALEELDRLFK